MPISGAHILMTKAKQLTTNRADSHPESDVMTTEISMPPMMFAEAKSGGGVALRRLVQRHGRLVQHLKATIDVWGQNARSNADAAKAFPVNSAERKHYMAVAFCQSEHVRDIKWAARHARVSLKRLR